MRIYFCAALVLAGLLGCSQDQPAIAEGGGKEAVHASAQGVPPPVLPREVEGGFASLPDQGALLKYDRVRYIKRSGAYTAYPVALSESHALNAIQSGELMVHAPDGELIRLRYERHVEHPDGNWSWIGRGADGADAVLTFGEKAVFGTIPQGKADSLRLTMFAGNSFLVSTDRSKLIGSNADVRRQGVDYLIPPTPTPTPDIIPSIASSLPEPAHAVGSSTDVIDLLLGYSTGFASQLGGQSQANTRLVNMVDITNQGYANSQVSMRVRLVHTMQVNYPDNTDNGSTLEKLTGYKSGAGPVPVDPAFNALRTARETYGADLVSLVRAFRTPENDGCGIAWLLGGNLSGVKATDSPFGYSVVSDGTDFNESDSKTYFCREETLAHELGHNMGQQHNNEISTTPGAHAYSYGYREASGSGFYTIMAYRIADSSQFGIRHFANPAVSYDGRPTGVANTADNVRSLGITMPVVAGFRASVTPVARKQLQDANADGTDDLFWHNASGGSQQNWLMNGASWAYGQVTSLGSQYRVAGIGDFNGDGRSDIIWYDAAKTTLWQWQARADGSYAVAYLRAYPTGWDIVGIRDANADGRADIFWHNPGAGLLQTWLMDGTAWVYGQVNAIGTQYRVAAVGDFNGDERADIIWHDAARTTLWQWQAQANGPYRIVYLRGYPAGWDIVGAKDANADGRDDLFWHNAGVGQQQNWLMDGTSWIYTPVNAIESKYRVAAIGDFNGDGRADLIWHDIAKTSVWQWQAQANGTYSVIYLRNYPVGWSVVN